VDHLIYFLFANGLIHKYADRQPTDDDKQEKDAYDKLRLPLIPHALFIFFSAGVIDLFLIHNPSCLSTS
jgi:hypothetical protein